LSQSLSVPFADIKQVLQVIPPSATPIYKLPFTEHFTAVDEFWNFVGEHRSVPMNNEESTSQQDLQVALMDVVNCFRLVQTDEQ
jgi:hypothetical protein